MSVQVARFEDVVTGRPNNLVVAIAKQVAKGAASFIEDLLHIFDSRMRMKKQTVVATAVRLEALQHKECPAEFIGRLMSGVAVRLGRPDKRMRIAALRRELRESGENFPDAVIEVMANASKKNMWSLGGMLHRVMFAREVMGKSALRQKNLDELLDK